MTTLTILKSFLFEFVSSEPTGKFLYGDHANQVQSDILKLKEIENKMGYLRTTDRNGSNEEPLPKVLMGEGTIFLYPYQTDIHTPSSIIVQREDEMEYAPLKGMKGCRRRSYQTRDFKTLLRFFNLYTLYFITHPILPINIPSLSFSSQLGEIMTWEKGISANDFLYYNFDEKTRISKMGKTRVIAFPNTRLRDLKRSVSLLKTTSTDKFQFCPLFRDPKTRKLRSRVQNQDSFTIPPNILPHLRQHVRVFLPEETKDYYWINIPTSRYFEFEKSVNPKDVGGIIEFDILPHITSYLIWLKNSQK